MNNYPKRWYEIDPQLLTIAANYGKVQMNYDFLNQYVYFSEDIDEKFTEPLIYELYIRVFVDSNHVYDKNTSIFITRLFSVVVSTSTTWS